MLFEAPVASDFHRLLTALRIVPELERSGDLAEHIASRAASGLAAELPPAVRGIIEQLGQKVAAMWRTAADAWADRDGSIADRLAEDDEVVNTLHERALRRAGRRRTAHPRRDGDGARGPLLRAPRRPRQAHRQAHPRQALNIWSATLVATCGGGEGRTLALRLKRPLLCQLSYTPECN